MDARVGAVVALKPFTSAKTRITGIDPSQRHDLTRAMALDTVAALRDGGAEVLVISDQPGLADTLAHSGLAGVRVLAEERLTDGRPGGLNHALDQGSLELRTEGIGTVVACVADLPALRSAHVRRVLRAHLGAGAPRSFLADSDGVGTTMLLATGVDLEPRFEGASAQRHQESGATPLTDDLLGEGVPGARRDVDDLASLVEAAEFGLGERTRSLLEAGT